MENKKGTILIWCFILFGIIIIGLFLSINKSLNYLFILGPLALLIIFKIFSYFPNNKIIKGVIVGGIIGLIWGLISLPFGIAVLEREVTLMKILIVLPFYLSRTIFKSEHLFVLFSLIIGSIMGLIVGLIIGWLMKSNKKEKNILHNDRNLGRVTNV